MLVWLSSARPQYGRFILLDRDGVLNVNRPDYIKSLAELNFYRDALEALAFLERNGVGVILVSNQSGINRGLIEWEDFREIHEGVIRRVEECGGRIQAAFYCPHRPDEKCECRKPAPAMIFAACRYAGIAPAQTFFAGDSESDMKAAENAGCRGVRICRTDGEVTTGLCAPEEPNFPTLLDAVSSIYGKGI
ncbi:MAG: HAD family hydrolase [Deltaproteobacteria bacterium]|jgi:D-glycero-D-manno-heptose 1,7-bisphosphate phosphatase|nr:HAD family hydrolase [Deltaproteobacteria bacterium]